MLTSSEQDDQQILQKVDSTFAHPLRLSHPAEQGVIARRRSYKPKL